MTKGGTRTGAGKPAFYGTAMKRYNVMLDEDTVSQLKALGEGNLSEGVRKAARMDTNYEVFAYEIAELRKLIHDNSTASNDFFVGVSMTTQAICRAIKKSDPNFNEEKFKARITELCHKE